MPEYVLLFDIPRQESVLRVRVNRALKLVDAKMVQRSIWKCGSLDDLKGIANFIREHGGKAQIVEWNKVY